MSFFFIRDSKILFKKIVLLPNKKMRYPANDRPVGMANMPQLVANDVANVIGNRPA